MAHPLHHSQSSVKRWGGKVEDYLPIHEFMDSSKQVVADWRHRALFHHAFGIYVVEQLFGTSLTLSTGREIPTRYVAEQHVREDLRGKIPSAADWLRAIPPQRWMAPDMPLDAFLETNPSADALEDFANGRYTIRRES